MRWKRSGNAAARRAQRGVCGLAAGWLAAGAKDQVHGEASRVGMVLLRLFA